MDYQAIECCLKKIGMDLRRNGIEVDRVYLFGSVLRGTDLEYSDIDVLMVAAGFGKLTIWQRAKLIGRLIRETSLPFEIMMLSEKEFDESPFAQKISEHAKRVDFTAA